jgi:hypothetical protein
MTDDEWHKVLDVTLTGTFRMTRAHAAAHEPRGRGVIVNNASVLGWRAQKEQAHYAAAKAGVMALTRCAALEAAEHGVRINAVAPSIAMHAFLKKSASEELLDELPAGGLWPRRRALGSGQRDGLPGQRLLELHDRRGRLGQLAARLRGRGHDHFSSAVAEVTRRRRPRPGPHRLVEMTQERIEHVCRRHRRPPVDPRRPRAGQGRPFRRLRRARLSDAGAGQLFLPSSCTTSNLKMGVNYGCDKVRFPAPVKAGARVRGRGEVVKAEPSRATACRSTVRVTVEIEGSDARLRGRHHQPLHSTTEFSREPIMIEAVIVSTARTALGKSFRGCLQRHRSARAGWPRDPRRARARPASSGADVDDVIWAPPCSRAPRLQPRPPVRLHRRPARQRGRHGDGPHVRLRPDDDRPSPPRAS